MYTLFMYIYSTYVSIEALAMSRSLANSAPSVAGIASAGERLDS
jgi:hypothetical protein